MRALLAIGCAACAGSAATPAAPRARADLDARAAAACDSTWWREAAASRERAWLLVPSRAPDDPGARAVTVLDARGTEVRVATATPDLVVACWVPLGSLAPVVALQTAVSPTPGGPPDPAVQVLPGLRVVGERSGDWFAVAPEPKEGLAFAGYVPRSSISAHWTVPDVAPRPPGRAFRIAGELHATPHADGSLRATVSRAAESYVTPVPTVPPGESWLAVTAVAASARVEGYLKVSPRPQKHVPGEFEWNDLVEGRLAPTLAAGTCLYDAPGGAVVGALLQPYPGKVSAARAGWSRLVVEAPWGDQALYTNAAPLPPVEPPVWTPEGIVD